MDRCAFYILTIFANVCVLEMMATTKINPLKIIDGDSTKPNQYPFMAFILDCYGGSCGGSLISHRYVLTAAHCIFGTPDAKIILGAHEIAEESPTKIIVTAEEFIIHSDYGEDHTESGNDIGIIKLSKPVELSHAVNILALPTRENINKEYAGSEAITMGWGYIEYNKYNIPRNDPKRALRQMRVAIKPLDECYNEVPDMSHLDLCGLGIHNKGICDGDSGSPLIIDNLIIGIVSRGPPYCNVTKPHIYVNVGKYLDWIAENSDVTISCK